MSHKMQIRKWDKGEDDKLCKIYCKKREGKYTIGPIELVKCDVETDDYYTKFKRETVSLELLMFKSNYIYLPFNVQLYKAIFAFTEFQNISQCF